MKKIVIFFCLLLISITLVSQSRSKVIETATLPSKILKMNRSYSIYLPAGYETNERSYPVLYLLHGMGDDHTGWTQFGEVQRIADKAIASGRVTPMIIVMPNANEKIAGYFNDIRGNYNYEDFFFEELIPHIQKNYRCRTDRRFRAIAGLSMGGGGSIFYTLHRPEMFATCAPLSAATGDWWIDQVRRRIAQGKYDVSEDQITNHFKQHNIPSLLENATPEKLQEIKSVRWYISNGDDDFLFEGNAMMHIAFRKAGINHEFRIKDGSHNWTYWRSELPILLNFVSKSFTQF